jgi:hypothetical protein
MTAQNYLQVENNVVTTIVVWDGDTNTWKPPSNAIMLVQATTPAMLWVNIAPVTMPPTPSNYVLQEFMGAGQIGFTWDGTFLTTNEPDPQL